MHHLQLIEQRRYHQIEVNWSEGMDPLQRVRAISAGTADFLSKMTDCDIQAADRALRLQVMPPGVSQVDLRLAAQFVKHSPEQNRAAARLAQFQLAIDKLVATIGRAHVCNPVTNAHLECRPMLEKNTNEP